MEWWEALWSPLWFFWDLIGTVAIITLIRHWIKSSVVETKTQVISELKDPKTAAAIRDAMDIVASADVKALTADVGRIREEVRQKDLSWTVALDARMGGLLQDVKAAVASIPKPDLTGLEERVRSAVGAAAGGQATKEIKAAQKAQEEMMAAYRSSQAAQYDLKYTTEMLTRMGVTPGMAAFGAQYGTLGVSWALEASFGQKRAAEMMGQVALAKMAAMPQPAGQMPQMPPGYR
jgi:hypothetical protein